MRVYQAIRDSRVLREDAGFHLVAWQIDAITSQDAEIRLSHLDEQIMAIEESLGLEGANPYFPAGHRTNTKWLAASTRTPGTEFSPRNSKGTGSTRWPSSFGPIPTYSERSDVGRQYFHGTDEPEEWLDDLVEAVAGNMTDESGPGTLGSRYREEDGCWEILIYPTPVELVGGAEDGEIVAPGFSLDLDGLRSLFERVNDFSWQALGLNYSVGPHVSIEGVYQGHEVWCKCWRTHRKTKSRG